MGLDLFAVANSLPWLPTEPIGAFRRAHYPTAHLLRPHLTLVFPVPATIGSDAFRQHVREVVSGTPAFDIRLRGLDKSWDHWLFLGVAKGSDEVIALHDALYTGILTPYLWTEQPYVPHVGLGHFAEKNDTRDPLTLRPRAFDQARFDQAWQEAEALRLDYTGRFDSVDIFGLDEELTHVTQLEEVPSRMTELATRGPSTLGFLERLLVYLETPQGPHGLRRPSTLLVRTPRWIRERDTRQTSSLLGDPTKETT